MKTADWEAWKLQRGCGRKRRFRFRGHVRKEAHRLGMGWYQCKYCGQYHLTSKAGQEARELQRQG